MAKVMVSLPDDLLRAVDVEALRRGTTRSGLLRELAEEALRSRSVRRAKRMAEIDWMDGPVVGPRGRRGRACQDEPAQTVSLWFVDASVLLACEDHDDDNNLPARQLLEGPDPLATLDLAFYETTNVATCSWRDASAALRLRERVVAIADDGGLVRAGSALLSAAATVAVEQGISVYDAAYVAAARASGAGS